MKIGEHDLGDIDDEFQGIQLEWSVALKSVDIDLSVDAAFAENAIMELRQALART